MAAAVGTALGPSVGGLLMEKLGDNDRLRMLADMTRTAAQRGAEPYVPARAAVVRRAGAPVPSITSPPRRTRLVPGMFPLSFGSV